MNDYLGNKIIIGDTVVYLKRSMNEYLNTAEVLGFDHVKGKVKIKDQFNDRPTYIPPLHMVVVSLLVNKG